MISFKILFISNVFLTIVSLYECSTGPEHNKLVVCYVGTWSVYRPGRGSFALEHLDPNLCSHIVYAFAGLNVTSDGIKPLDPWQDLTEDYGKGGFQRAVALKDRYPHLKVTLAIGGWNEGSSNYSALAANPVRRKRFVVNSVEFLRKYRFDGLDLDWEFPGKRGGSPDDKQNFLSLVKELRKAFDPFNLLLTAAFGAGKDTIDIAYDVRGLSDYLDYIHLMCYDYHGSWDQKTGANAPLHSKDVLSVEYSINYMIELGVQKETLIVGLPLYGRTFLLSESSVSDELKGPRLGALASNVGFQGQFSKEDGFMGYNEICIELQTQPSSWKIFWDEESKTPFAVNGNKVITYDDEQSITEKVKFAMEKGIGGAMVWSIDTDDFQGDCTENKGTYHNFPLMRTINKAIVQTLQDIKDRENEIDYTGKNNQKGKGFTIHNVSIHSLLLLTVSIIFLSHKL